MSDEKSLAEFKLKRRTAKAALTRLSKTLRIKLDSERLSVDVEEAFQKVRQAYEDLVTKHEEYAQNITDDEAFEQEEHWLEESQDMFIQLEILARDYISGKANKLESVGGSSKQPEEAGTSTGSVDQTENVEAETVEEASSINVTEQQMPALVVNNDTEISTNKNGNGNNAGNTVLESTTGNAGTPSNNSLCGFKMEKPKMPLFSGDVRDYVIFRSDFKHAVDTRYSKRDALSLLRTCLSGKPLDLIKGIGSDYDGAWEHLDSLYGDPRFVADTVTHDIAKFKPLREDEDSRFCDLVKLVKRSYNTLKEVNRPFDMDNNHMLALIGPRMYVNDRKVWSRHLETSKKQASLENLIEWMTTEMKTRMRAKRSLEL